MSRKFLKTDTLDIHAGGRDLIFPHHENEIAQAEALTGKDFAKYWIHHGLLTINAQKMSKSLGNFITIKDFADKHKDPDLLKLFFLAAHYSHPIDYSEDKIAEAKKQKKTFTEFFERVDTFFMFAGKPVKTFTKEEKEKIDGICVRFTEALDDDFNTPQALASLFELIALGLRFISEHKITASKYIRKKLAGFLNILGLSVPGKKKLSRHEKRRIKDMGQARIKKDYDGYDRMKKEFIDEGCSVSNTSSSITISHHRVG